MALSQDELNDVVNQVLAALTTSTIDDLPTKVTVADTDELELQVTAGGASAKTTALQLVNDVFANGNVVLGLNDLSDVSLTAPANLNVLQSNGIDFVNRSPDAAGLLDKTTTQTASGAKTFTNAVLTTSKVDSTNIGLTTPAAGNFTTVDGNLGSVTPAPAAVTTLTATTLVNVATDMTIALGSILSASGAITFGNENLDTTGTLSSGAFTGTTIDGVIGSVTPAAGSFSQATMTGEIAMGANKITGVLDPTLAQDAATKAYVDAVPIEGTFSPVLTDGTNDATMDIQVGWFTRVGNLVTFTMSVKTSALASVSGAVSVSGLPFTSANVTDQYGGAMGTFGAGLGGTASENITGIIAPNTAVMALFRWNGAAGTGTLGSAQWTDDGHVRFIGTYTAA